MEVRDRTMSFTKGLNVLEPPLLEFKAGKKGIDPVMAFAVLDYNPLEVPDLSSTPKIYPLIPKHDKTSKNVMTILNDLRRGKMGKYPRSKYKAFSKTFGFDIEIEDCEEYEGESDVYRKITEVSRLSDRKAHIIVVVSPERSQLGGFYYDIKKTSTEKEVQTQFILRKTIENYVQEMDDSDRGDFLWNFSFGIFSKLGGTPWKLHRVLEGVSAFMSINTVSSYAEQGITERKGVVALELANSWGNPIGRFYVKDVGVEVEEGAIFVDLKTIDALTKKALDQVEQELADAEKSKAEDYVIVHIKDRYADQVYDKIASAIAAKGFRKFKIIHIQEQGPLRLYDTSKSRGSSWPQEGTYWYLEDGNIAFLYTLGGWRYSISEGKEPYVIGTHDVSPLQVNFTKGDENSRLTNDDLRHIYHLTRLHYYSADLPRIKMPFTLRLGERAARLAASGLASLDFPISFLY